MYQEDLYAVKVLWCLHSLAWSSC